MNTKVNVGKYYAEYREKFGTCVARQKQSRFVYCVASDPKNPVDCPFVNSERLGISKKDKNGKKIMQWFCGCNYQKEY